MAPTGGETDDQQEETDQGGETGDEEATDGGGEQGDWEEEEQDGERDASDGGGDGAEPTDWEKDEEEGLSDEEDAGQDAEEEDWEDEEPPAPPPVRKYPPGPRAVGKPARPSLRYSNRTVMKNYTYSSWVRAAQPPSCPAVRGGTSQPRSARACRRTAPARGNLPAGRSLAGLSRSHMAGSPTCPFSLRSCSGGLLTPCLASSAMAVRCAVRCAGGLHPQEEASHPPLLPPAACQEGPRPPTPSPQPGVEG